ncbi:MAG: hypothetical protein ACRD9L_00235 [Bryobacteraceae bacterium]
MAHYVPKMKVGEVTMRFRFLLCLYVAAAAALCAATNPNELVRSSVAKIEADWKAAPRYSYHERDVNEKLDSDGEVSSKTINTYQVILLDGSEYRKLIAHANKPLSSEELAQQEQKLNAEGDRRRHESSSDRAKRVSLYEKERQQNQRMLLELVDAFNFRLRGRQTIDGRKTWVLDATPKPGYVPKTRETKVLVGMRGRMWIDEQENQWVKVQAKVIKPVSFVFGFASVSPGTEFILEQAPIAGTPDLWLPTHFEEKVNANILWFHHKTSLDQTYTNYRLAQPGNPQVADKHP